MQGDPTAEAALHCGLAALMKIYVDCLAENFSDSVRARNWRRVLRTGFLFAGEKGRAALGLRS